MAHGQIPMRQINIRVSEKVYSRLEALSKIASTSVTAYVGLIFDAAYAARVKGTPDLHLDAQVALVGLATLSGAELEPIAETAGLPLPVAERMRDGRRSVLEERRRG